MKKKGKRKNEKGKNLRHTENTMQNHITSNPACGVKQK